MSKIVDGVKGDESYPLKQISENDEISNEKKDINNEKNDADPVKEKLLEDENAKNQSKNVKERIAQCKYWNNRKIRMAILSVLALLLVLVFVSIFLTSMDDDDVDDTYRMMRTVPMPNGRRNLLRIRRSELDDLSAQQKNGISDLVLQIDAFFDRHDTEKLLEEGKGKENFTLCTRGELAPNQFCVASLGPIREACKPSEKYGYPAGSPCIMILVNPILNWIPEKYLPNDANNTILPQSIRDELANGYSNPMLNCEPRDLRDKENVGNITYYPSRRFDEAFFPYTPHPYYVEPFIAVKFESLTPNVVVNIDCRLWTKNLQETSIPSPILPLHILIE